LILPNLGVKTLISFPASCVAGGILRAVLAISDFGKKGLISCVTKRILFLSIKVLDCVNLATKI
jgi:hypothetical protein